MPLFSESTRVSNLVAALLPTHSNIQACLLQTVREVVSQEPPSKREALIPLATVHAPRPSQPCSLHLNVFHNMSAIWAIIYASNAHLFSPTMCRAVAYILSHPKKSKLTGLPFPLTSWKKKCKLVFYLVAGDESAEQEILLAQVLLIPWAGRVWYRVRAGNGAGFFSGNILKGEHAIQAARRV